MKSYKELVVWQRSFALANDVYSFTAGFPKHQQFSLVSQMQRAALSVPSNIAEGYNRNSRKEYVRYLSIALGSVAELETQVMLAREQKFIASEAATRTLGELDEIGKMLRAMQKRLAATP